MLSLQPAGLDDDPYGPFREEIEVLKQLQHPNTLRILDCGQKPDRLPHLVTALVDGWTLEDVSRAAAAAGRRGAFSQVLAALNEAHGGTAP